MTQNQDVYLIRFCILSCAGGADKGEEKVKSEGKGTAEARTGAARTTTSTPGGTLRFLGLNYASLGHAIYIIVNYFVTVCKNSTPL